MGHAALVTFLIAAALAQGQPVVRWAASDSRCGQRWKDGTLYRRVVLPQVAGVEADMAEVNGQFFVEVRVRNNGTSSIDVLPSKFQLQITEPPGKVFGALPPEKAIAKVGVWERIAAGAQGAQEGLESTQQRRTGSATVANPDGTTSRVDVYENGPTPQEQEQKRNRQDQAAQVANARARWNAAVSMNALRENTIEPGKSVFGTVIFPREKRKYRELLVTIPIGSAIFEFPFAFK